VHRVVTDVPQPPPGAVLAQLIAGNRLQQAVYVAAKLGIADLLADGPRTTADLAQAAGAHGPSLYRLLRALASLGIFAEEEDGRFSLTPLAALLQSGVPGSLRTMALFSGDITYQAFGALQHSVRTGESGFRHVYGVGLFEYLEAHPDLGAVFDEFMTRQTAPAAPAVVAAYDFAGVDTLVDVGGGHGELLAAVLAAHPEMRGVLFDQPHVVAGARGRLESAGVADRCQVVGGDLFAAVPSGGDAYVLKGVVHGWDDAQAAAMLQNCRRAMAAGGKLLLVDFVVPPGNAPFPGKLLDVWMLVASEGGRERTAAEFGALLQAAGFQQTRIIPTAAQLSVIEAIPA